MASTSNPSGDMVSTSSSSASSTIIKFRTSDDMQFEVEESVALESELIKRLIEDAGCADNVIPTPNVTAPIFSVIIGNCKKKHANLKWEKKELESWDKKFAETHSMDTDKLLSSIGNQGTVSPVRPECHVIKGKTPEDICKIFNIKDDFTLEEEIEINGRAFE